MFSSKPQAPNPAASPFSLQSPFGVAASGAKDTSKKKKSPQEEYEMALMTAHVFIEESRGRIAKQTARYQGVAESNYWYYGYFGGSMTLTMAACLGIGSRVQFFRSYSGWIALVGGYVGCKMCMGVHTAKLVQDVVKQIDHEISEATRLDEETKHVVPDYTQEVERLKQIKYGLVPTLPEAIEAREQQQHMTLDDRADALVAAYMKRKEGMAGKK